MRPYRPNTSAKMRIRIIPTNSLGCWAVPRTPASPTMPMAKPAAKPEKPTARPAPKWMKPLENGKKYINICYFGQMIILKGIF